MDVTAIIVLGCLSLIGSFFLVRAVKAHIELDRYFVLITKACRRDDLEAANRAYYDAALLIERSSFSPYLKNKDFRESLSRAGVNVHKVMNHKPKDNALGLEEC